MSFLSHTNLKYYPYYLEGIFPGILISLKHALQTIVVMVTVIQSAYGQQIQVKSQNGHSIKFYKRYHAMVVGVGQYEHWPSKPNAVQDAREVSWELRRHGFMVRLLTDPSAYELEKALNRFVQRNGKEADQGVVFYYSGHSQTIISEDGQKDGWIIPKDTPLLKENRQEFMAKAISTEAMVAMSGRMRSKHLLFLFDTAFSADNFHREATTLKIIDNASMLPVKQVITAGRAGESISPESDFKRFLLQGLQGEADLIYDGMISGSELGLYLADRVSKVSSERLHPQFGRFTGSGSPNGDFIFRAARQPLHIARLFVEPSPKDAKIQIVNIIPKFKQGIELRPGEYHLHVSAQGHETVEQQIRLTVGEDRTVKIRLPKEKEMLVNSLDMHFIRIRPGNFMMGSPETEPGRSSDEILHRVTLTRHFFMQQTEVTVRQFKRFVHATGYRTEAEKSGGCWITSSGNRWRQKSGTSWQRPRTGPLDEDLPVVCVTWNDAAAFARWLSKKEHRIYRLPTEAQWEYAGRAGTSTSFSTGRCLSTNAANYAKIDRKYRDCTVVFNETRRRPIKAGLLLPNPWKLYNMHGNVSEWCLDWYGFYPSDSATDPTGPSTGNERVMRGGHWQASAAECRLAKRRRFPPGIASDVVGFRLVMLP
jgi:formylglycine-generating enzyme required for sulfatase activity